ncbi:ZZ-type domain-containing protein, partial [Durusdinium trenchii]
AQEGLDPSLQKMLEIIQEQAAKTPGLEHHAALIAEALSGDNGQRRLGEALLELLKALEELGPQVTSPFCEAVASSLLPLLEEITEWPMAWKGKGKGKCKGKHKHWKGCEPNASDESKVDVPAAAASAAPGVADNEDIPWTKGSGKCKGKHWKGCWFGFGAEPASGTPAETPQQDAPFTRQSQDTGDGADGERAGAWGPAGCPWKLMGLLSTLRMLKESGALAAMLPCVAVQWLPFLTKIVAGKVEKINRRAQEGLDPSLQKMLEIIQ